MSKNTENRELFGAVRDHLNKADLSSAEKFDKAILTLSTAGLGFSIALLKFVIPVQSATHTGLLQLSWFCFALAIVLTVVSFMTARAAIRDTRMYAFMYYMKSDDDYGDKVSPYSRATYWLNGLSGLVFITAVVLTVTFVSFNVTWDSDMQDQNNSNPLNKEESWTLSLYARGGTILRLDYPSLDKCLSAGDTYIVDESAERFDCGSNCIEPSIDLTRAIRCEQVCNAAGCR